MFSLSGAMSKVNRKAMIRVGFHAYVALVLSGLPLIVRASYTTEYTQIKGALSNFLSNRLAIYSDG